MRAILPILSLACATLLRAQAPPRDPFLDQLVGTWQASGTVAGERIGYDIQAKWILQDNFLAIDLTDTAKAPQYMAHVSIGYDAPSKRYVMHWLDIFGARSSETLGYGTLQDNTIAFRFEYPDGPFINAFTFDRSARTWTSHATTKNSKGEWEVFSDITLKPR
mgnify:CR=1 FL=1